MKLENLSPVGKTSPVTAWKPGDVAETVPSTPENAAAQKQEKQRQEIPKDRIPEAVDVVNDFMKMVNVRFEYRFDDAVKRAVVEVYDEETGDKIRQCPPEEILNMLEKMYDMLGVLIDHKV